MNLTCLASNLRSFSARGSENGHWKIREKFPKSQVPTNKRKKTLAVCIFSLGNVYRSIRPIADSRPISDLKLLQNVVRDDDLGGDPGRDLILTFTLCSYLILL